jgi:hypothetical protein
VDDIRNELENRGYKFAHNYIVDEIGEIWRSFENKKPVLDFVNEVDV